MQINHLETETSGEAAALSPREKSKSRRRAQIVEAARRLILQHESTEFSMYDLAREAGTSMKTTYNLIGSKSAVLYVLLSAAVDSIAMQPATARPGDITAIVDLPDIPIGLFTSEPGFYRPLLRYLLGVANSTERPIFMARAYAFWLRGVTDIAEACDLRFVPSIMALHLHTYFAGALDLWVQDEIDADGFRSHMRCAAAMALLPLAEAAQRQALQAHVDAFVPTAQAYESAAARTVSAI
jgi:AcrR family transcriptional regulator